MSPAKSISLSRPVPAPRSVPVRAAALDGTLGVGGLNQEHRRPSRAQEPRKPEQRHQSQEHPYREEGGAGGEPLPGVKGS